MIKGGDRNTEENAGVEIWREEKVERGDKGMRKIAEDKERNN